MKQCQKRRKAKIGVGWCRFIGIGLHHAWSVWMPGGACSTARSLELVYTARGTEPGTAWPSKAGPLLGGSGCTMHGLSLMPGGARSTAPGKGLSRLQVLPGHRTRHRLASKAVPLLVWFASFPAEVYLPWLFIHCERGNPQMKCNSCVMANCTPLRCGSFD